MRDDEVFGCGVTRDFSVKLDFTQFGKKRTVFNKLTLTASALLLMMNVIIIFSTEYSGSKSQMF